jgi:hypothetical protein
MIPVEYTMQQLHHCRTIRSLLHAAAVSMPYHDCRFDTAATPLLPPMLHAAAVSVPYYHLAAATPLLPPMLHATTVSVPYHSS